MAKTPDPKSYEQILEEGQVFFLGDGAHKLEGLVSSKNIKIYETRLNESMFFRTHKSHIINLAYHLNEFSRSQGNIAILSNNTQVPISRRKLPEFLSRISQIA